MINKYLNTNICKQCGGSCCKFMGCHFSPEDFQELSFESLKNEINKGHISIDWWEGDPRPDGDLHEVYYLRMRNRQCDIVDASWGGRPCVMLSKDGCSLPFEKRPKGGRLLIPKENFNCNETDYSKKQCALDWIKYQDILRKLYRLYFYDIP